MGRIHSFCKAVLSVLAMSVLASPSVSADGPASTQFGSVAAGSAGEPDVIGRYTQGCIAGAIQLPETGPTWQAMRLDRNRHWGHPVLIDYIIDLSERASQLGWNGLYVGDMSQPRGGPMTSGHASHQIGLDVDIWMLAPGRLDLTRQEREEISSISVRSNDQRSVNSNWTDTHMEVLKAAASDPRVDRILVSAAVKVAMCENAGTDRAWLQRIRPWYQHNYHFHVRLKCPSDALYCLPQRPTVEELSDGGDGCDAGLEWWVTDYADSLTKPAKEAPPSPIRGSQDLLMSDLPAACGNVLASD